MKSATAWALGQLGRHTPDHAKAVADTGVLPLLVTLENDTHSTEDLKGKCRKALKAIVAKLTFMPALDALVHRSVSVSGLGLGLLHCCAFMLSLSFNTHAVGIAVVLCMPPGVATGCDCAALNLLCS